MDKRPDLSDGGLNLPLNEGDLLRFYFPKDTGICSKVSPGVEHVNSAVDSDRLATNCFLMNYDGGRPHLVAHLVGEPASCEVCWAFDKAPRPPI